MARQEGVLAHVTAAARGGGFKVAALEAVVISIALAPRAKVLGACAPTLGRVLTILALPCSGGERCGNEMEVPVHDCPARARWREGRRATASQQREEAQGGSGR